MLKVQEIKDAKHSGIGTAPLKLSDGGGLQLHVFANGRKTWITKYNPAIGVVDDLDTHPVVHMARISVLELPKFIKDIESYQGEYTSVLAIKMMMLCFVRTGELRGMQWQEIDWENRIWRLPAERMKSRRPHLVPLSNEALQILNNLKEINSNSKYVFSSSRAKDGKISSHSILGAIKRMGYSGKMTGHGFRGLA